MPQLTSVCVYCASSTGTNDTIVAATRELGNLLAERGIGLVYGGGAVGLMGLVADTVLEAGGTVTGIIPLSLFPKEVTKPVGVLNIDGYWDGLLSYLDRAVGDGLLKEQNNQLLLRATTPADMLTTLETYEGSAEPKWL